MSNLDVRIENHGSILLFRPLTRSASDWLRNNTDGQWFGNALVVEHRYAGDLAEGMIQEGFRLI